MKENCTEIVFILDESGSMWHLTDDTIGGFNSYLEEQKRHEGEAYITTVLFSTDYKVIHDHVDIKDVSPRLVRQSTVSVNVWPTRLKNSALPT